MSKTERERRAMGDAPAVADPAGRRIAGYALKFGTISEDLGGFRETIAPGAVTRTLDHGGDVLARTDHDPTRLLGRTSSGTLRLTADAVGLRYEVDVPDTSFGRDLLEQVARGDVRQSSFEFRAIRDSWTVGADGAPLRTLLEIALSDVAPVVTPAYTDTSVAVRSLPVPEAAPETVSSVVEAQPAPVDPPKPGHSLDSLRRRLEMQRTR